MKINEKIILDEKGMIIKKTHSATPVLERVQMAREVGNPLMSEAWHVASLPPALVHQKARERGVRLDDHDGMQDVLMEIIRDSQFNKFRVKEGNI